MDIVLLFPGQGSQHPGMARGLADAFPEARAVLEQVDDALGVALTTLMYEGPQDELTRTHNAQPALLAHGAAAWAVARERLGGSVRAAAGHSLGEFTAYHAAGSLSVADAVRLVRRRGELMYESGTRRPGAMAAILGDPSPSIEAICEQASAEDGLVVAANYNSPGQVVISGEVEAVERAMALAKAAGAKRALKLNVSGAFHSPLMADAAAGLGEALAATPFDAPAFPIAANVTAELVTDAGRGSALLLEQLTSPVRWTEDVRALVERWPEALYLEMGPGTVLTGLVKKIAPGTRVQTCGTVAELEQVLELVAR
jgi:[acyl-carrier-protein] S-malonyltransferase